MPEIPPEPPFAIRPAQAADTEAIAHVHVASWRSTYRGLVPDAYLAMLDEAERVPMWRAAAANPGVHLLVAEQAGVIVGFACAGALRAPLENQAEAFDAELYAIYLLNEAQGHGIGTALLSAISHRLLAAGFTSMAVWVLAANASARFYQKTGAHWLTQQPIEIAGASLEAAAYGWPSLATLAAQS
jgi:L-amino acid N-acyltransferase YncA